MPSVDPSDVTAGDDGLERRLAWYLLDPGDRTTSLGAFWRGRSGQGRRALAASLLRSALIASARGATGQKLELWHMVHRRWRDALQSKETRTYLLGRATEAGAEDPESAVDEVLDDAFRFLVPVLHLGISSSASDPGVRVLHRILAGSWTRLAGGDTDPRVEAAMRAGLLDEAHRAVERGARVKAVSLLLEAIEQASEPIVAEALVGELLSLAKEEDGKEAQRRSILEMIFNESRIPPLRERVPHLYELRHMEAAYHVEEALRLVKEQQKFRLPLRHLSRAAVLDAFNGDAETIALLLVGLANRYRAQLEEALERPGVSLNAQGWALRQEVMGFDLQPMRELMASEEGRTLLAESKEAAGWQLAERLMLEPADDDCRQITLSLVHLLSEGVSKGLVDNEALRRHVVAADPRLDAIAWPLVFGALDALRQEASEIASEGPVPAEDEDDPQDPAEPDRPANRMRVSVASLLSRLPARHSLALDVGVSAEMTAIGEKLTSTVNVGVPWKSCWIAWDWIASGQDLFAKGMAVVGIALLLVAGVRFGWQQVGSVMQDKAYAAFVEARERGDAASLDSAARSFTWWGVPARDDPRSADILEARQGAILARWSAAIAQSDTAALGRLAEETASLERWAVAAALIDEGGD